MRIFDPILGSKVRSRNTKACSCLPGRALRSRNTKACSWPLLLPMLSQTFFGNYSSGHYFAEHHPLTETIFDGSSTLGGPAAPEDFFDYNADMLFTAGSGHHRQRFLPLAWLFALR